MNNQQSPRSIFSRFPFYYGWVIVGVGFLTVFFTGPGQTHSFSMFINEFIEEFGWSRTQVSSMYTYATLISGTSMFAVGRLVDKIGTKKAAIMATLLLAGACLFNSFIANPIMLFFGFFLGRFSGQGTLNLSGGTLAPRWFLKKRALAIMLVGLGGTLGAMVFPMLNNYLISAFGWRDAFRILGGALVLIYLPICILFMKNQPEDIGLHPDGARILENTTEDLSEFTDEVSLTQGQALKSSAFYILALCIAQWSLIGTGMGFHFVSIMGDIGFDRDFAARAMSISPFVCMVGTILVGLVIGKMKRPHLMMTVAMILEICVLCLLAFVKTPFMAYSFAVLKGIMEAFLVMSQGVLIPYLFGRKYIGGIMGIIMMITVLGSGLGPLPFGIAYDKLGQYDSLLLMFTALPVAAAILSLFLKRPKQHL